METIARKDKSLSLLCKKFMSFYPVYPDPNEQILVSLDQMAKTLCVERRRIYDIVNVLESVEILSRFRKNQYIWHGFTQIAFTLSKLKTLSVKSKFVEYTHVLMLSKLDLHYDTKQAENVCFEPRNDQGGFIPSVETKDNATQTISISREEKSLGIMSQKFLMLFLTSEDGVVSINFAARVLLGDIKNDITEHGRYKTKIRRLYDIANVLSSIGLIKKYQHQGLSISKPAYKYVGPQVDIMRGAEYVYDFINSGNQMSNSKHSLFDHFKRNLNLQCNIPKFDVNTGILTSKDDSWKKNPINLKVETHPPVKQPIFTQDSSPVVDLNNNVTTYPSAMETYNIIPENTMIPETYISNEPPPQLSATYTGNINLPHHHISLPHQNHQKLQLLVTQQVPEQAAVSTSAFLSDQRSEFCYITETDLVFREQYPSMHYMSSSFDQMNGSVHMNQMNAFSLPSISTVLN